MKKIKILSILFLLFLCLGTYDILSNTFSLFGTNSLHINNIKNKIKNTVFYIPSQIKENKRLNKLNKIYRSEIENNTQNIQDLYNYSKVLSSFELIKKSSKKLISENENQYEIIFYNLPLLDYNTSKGKPVGYIEQHKDKIIILSGDGQSFYFKESDIGDSIINLIKINNNLKNFNFFKTINEKGLISIRDIEIYNENLYISVVNKKENNCIQLQIYKSNLSQVNNLNFEIFYNLDECLIKDDYLEMNLGQTGGRIIFHKNNLIFSTGGFRTRIKPQDDNSLYGKILAINLDTKKSKIISKGHRNIQGLTIFKNIIISTEHGPNGGDEVNIHKDILSNQEIPNYGWPISSYGEHYKTVIKNAKNLNRYSELIKIAPLNKSHSKFGFIEPIRYFSPASVAISEIEVSNSNFNKNFINDVYFGTLRNSPDKRASIYHLKFDKEFNKIIFEDKIVLNHRVRDLKIPSENDKMYLMLETTPSLGVLKKIN